MVRSILSRSGYELVRARPQNTVRSDIYGDAEFLRVYKLCKPYTMTSMERMYALWEACRYVVRSGIPGAVVECGVWKGGSCMLCALAFMHLGVPNRDIYLYDTFDGMPSPGSQDVRYDGIAASELVEGKLGSWCRAGVEEVLRNVESTGYPRCHIKIVKGKVEETLKTGVPREICLLRLDTDWYSSTYAELRQLYPLLSYGGVLIIDDYGHWQGARRAVDEYFEEEGLAILLNRIDYTGRIGVKTLVKYPRCNAAMRGYDVR